MNQPLDPRIPQTSHYCYLGIGANLNNPAKQIQSGLKALATSEMIELMQVSSLYESEAIGPSQPNYINAAAKISTRLSPENLLDTLQDIEQNNGRTREVRWGPRTLDLDILLYDQLELNTQRLSIPHREMTHRAFVLIPLLEIAPSLCLPEGTPLEMFLHTVQHQKVRKYCL